MPQATIVASWQDADQAYLAVRVTETRGDVEYVGAVPLADLAGKTAAQRRTALIAAAKAARDATVPAAPTDLGLSGTVTI